jgi:hypothetical protein
MAGGELPEWLAGKGDGGSVKNHAIETFPDMIIKELRDVQRRYSDMFKHATDQKAAAADPHAQQS